MLTVTILMVGKTRESFVREGLSFYEKRLQPFLHLTLKNVREEKEAGGLSAETIRVREGERLRAQIPSRALVIALTPQGREFTSEEFAAWLTRRESESRPLAYLIGGHLGLDPGTLADRGKPGWHPDHELAVSSSSEQLCRAMTIKTGHHVWWRRPPAGAVGGRLRLPKISETFFCAPAILRKPPPEIRRYPALSRSG
jgi:23S rRNA (pseudouridine1915-N3)-methyltransferase